MIQQARDPEDRQLNMLCSVEALRVLAEPPTEDDEPVRSFAKEVCSDSFTPQRTFMSDELERLMETIEVSRDPDTTKSVAELFSEIVAAAEGAEAQFVGDFCAKMFSADYFERSNSKKVSLYQVFQSAAEAVALFEDEDSPAERLATRIARAESYLFDTPNAALFRDAIIRAFQESEFGDFVRLAEEIRKAEASENLRRLAFRKIGPRKVVLDRDARRLMNARVPLSRRDRDNPISRREVAAALASRRKKP
jgi:hypothetical protein